MNFLLDTDHLSLIQRPTGREYVTVVANMNLRGGTTHACVVNFHEQSLGCHDQINSARTPADVGPGLRLVGSGHPQLHGLPDPAVR